MSIFLNAFRWLPKEYSIKHTLSLCLPHIHTHTFFSLYEQHIQTHTFSQLYQKWERGERRVREGVPFARLSQSRWSRVFVRRPMGPDRRRSARSSQTKLRPAHALTLPPTSQDGTPTRTAGFDKKLWIVESRINNSNDNDKCDRKTYLFVLLFRRKKLQLYSVFVGLSFNSCLVELSWRKTKLNCYGRPLICKHPVRRQLPLPLPTHGDTTNIFLLINIKMVDRLHLKKSWLPI
jgi:hypothetical protein